MVQNLPVRIPRRKNKHCFACHKDGLDLILALRNEQKGIPLQGLLVGSCASTFLGDSVTVQIVDRECHMAKIAAAYFALFGRQLVRTVVANLPESLTMSGDSSELCQELALLLSRTIGLIVVREAEGAFTIKEYCAYRSNFDMDRVQAILSEQAICEMDLLAGADATQLSYYDDLDGVSALAFDELLDRLRAEQLETTVMAEGHAQGALSSDDLVLYSRGMRRTRRRRPSLGSCNAGELVLEACPLPGDGPLLVRNAVHGKRAVLFKTTEITLCNVELIPGPGSQFLESLLGDCPLREPISLESSISTKEICLEETLQKCTQSLEEYTEGCREYEMLLLIYKILSQPDDVLLRKMSLIEEYEDRMKKLSARLKHSLSPEDLLRTLISIQQLSSHPSSQGSSVNATLNYPAASMPIPSSHPNGAGGATATTPPTGSA